MFQFKDEKKTSSATPPVPTPSATAEPAPAAPPASPAARTGKRYSAATLDAYQRTKKQLAAKKTKNRRDWGWRLATVGGLLIRVGSAARGCSGVVASNPLLIALGILVVLPGLYLLYKSFF